MLVDAFLSRPCRFPHHGHLLRAHADLVLPSESWQKTSLIGPCRHWEHVLLVRNSSMRTMECRRLRMMLFLMSLGGGEGFIRA